MMHELLYTAGLGDMWNAISDEIALRSDVFNVLHPLAERA